MSIPVSRFRHIYFYARGMIHDIPYLSPRRLLHQDRIDRAREEQNQRRVNPTAPTRPGPFYSGPPSMRTQTSINTASSAHALQDAGNDTEPIWIVILFAAILIIEPVRNGAAALICVLASFATDGAIVLSAPLLCMAVAVSLIALKQNKRFLYEQTVYVGIAIVLFELGLWVQSGLQNTLIATPLFSASRLIELVFSADERMHAIRSWNKLPTDSH